MILADEVLFRDMERMPDGNEHSIVWHLCHENTHPGCSSKIGQLALVSATPPEVTLGQEGQFLMRLHPLTEDIEKTPDGELRMWLPKALSFPHSTVWHIPGKHAQA